MSQNTGIEKNKGKEIFQIGNFQWVKKEHISDFNQHFY